MRHVPVWEFRLRVMHAISMCRYQDSRAAHGSVRETTSASAADSESGSFD